MEELVTPLLSVNQLYDCIIGFLPFNENVPKFTQCEDVLTKFISNNNQDTLYLIKSIERKHLEYQMIFQTWIWDLKI